MLVINKEIYIYRDGTIPAVEIKNYLLTNFINKNRPITEIMIEGNDFPTSHLIEIFKMIQNKELSGITKISLKSFFFNQDTFQLINNIINNSNIEIEFKQEIKQPSRPVTKEKDHKLLSLFMSQYKYILWPIAACIICANIGILSAALAAIPSFSYMLTLGGAVQIGYAPAGSTIIANTVAGAIIGEGAAITYDMSGYITNKYFTRNIAPKDSPLPR